MARRKDNELLSPLFVIIGVVLFVLQYILIALAIIVVVIGAVFVIGIIVRELKARFYVKKATDNILERANKDTYSHSNENNYFNNSKLINVYCPYCNSLNSIPGEGKYSCRVCDNAFHFGQISDVAVKCPHCKKIIFVSGEGSFICPKCKESFNYKKINSMLELPSTQNSLQLIRTVKASDLIRRYLRMNPEGATSAQVYNYCVANGAVFSNTNAHEQRKSISGQLSKMKGKGEVIFRNGKWFLRKNAMENLFVRG